MKRNEQTGNEPDRLALTEKNVGFYLDDELDHQVLENRTAEFKESTPNQQNLQKNTGGHEISALPERNSVSKTGSFEHGKETKMSSQQRKDKVDMQTPKKVNDIETMSQYSMGLLRTDFFQKINRHNQLVLLVLFLKGLWKSFRFQQLLHRHPYHRGTRTTGVGGPLEDLNSLPLMIEGLRLQEQNTELNLHELELDRIFIGEKKITLHEDKLYLELGKTKKINMDTLVNRACSNFCKALNKLIARRELDGFETATMYCLEKKNVDYVLWKLIYFDLVRNHLSQLTDDQINKGQVTATWNNKSIDPQETKAIILALKKLAPTAFIFELP